MLSLIKFNCCPANEWLYIPKSCQLSSLLVSTFDVFWQFWKRNKPCCVRVVWQWDDIQVVNVSHARSFAQAGLNNDVHAPEQHLVIPWLSGWNPNSDSEQVWILVCAKWLKH
jgi:hypothetical protein